MGEVFVEVVVHAVEAAAAGIDSRDEIEEPIEQALSSGLGEVTGGGGGGGIYVVDVEVDEDRFDEALAVLRAVMRRLNAPASTVIRRRTPPGADFSIDG